MSTLPWPTVRLPHRVRLTRTGDRWRWICPACLATSDRGRHRYAIERADIHARHCPELRALNLRALACWNCDGTGLVGGGICLVCLGRRFTTEPDPAEPDPTKEK